jgi:hypothetical protein
MFAKSITQEDMFKSAGSAMEGRTRKLYEDKNAWHNQFRVHVTNKIDEEIFKPLFSNEKGAPNAPIRVLIGMMIIKEGQGISDEHLYDEARFNLRTRSALGLLNIDDEPPVESTYYLLRQRIVEYEQKTGINLMDSVFKKLTKEQCIEFAISGKHIRMDSKLLGSNIAWYSRYGIVHETMRLFYRANEAVIPDKLKAAELEALKNIYNETGDSVTYRSTKQEVEKKFAEIGALMYVLVKSFKGLEGQTEYETLKRVFEEQYKIEQAEGEKKTIAVPREKQEISAKSVQNPHDTDCHYRNKNGSGIKGYSVNITETCDKGKLNLLVDVQTKPASAPDNGYVTAAIDSAAELACDKIEVVHTDGAYHSPENQEYCQSKGIELVTGGVQGKPSKYDLELDEEQNLIVINKETGVTLPAVIAKSKNPDAPKRWRVQDTDRNPLYFSEQDVQTCRLRKKMEALPKEVRNIRNNVEAAIFQLGYHYRADKSRYRGLAKHRMWAIARCLWVNFRRIAAIAAKLGADFRYIFVFFRCVAAELRLDLFQTV